MYKSASLRVVACLGLLHCLGVAWAGDTAHRPVKRIVQDVRHVPARDLAQLLGKVYQADPRVQVLPAPAGNTLVIRAPADELAGILDLVKRLDRRPRHIVVEVFLAEIPPGKAEAGKPPPTGKALDERAFLGKGEDAIRKLQELQKQGRIGELKRFRLTAAENQPASVLLGEHLPMTAGMGAGKRLGGRAITYRNVGTLVRATARLGEGDRITLDLHIADARMRSPGDGLVVGQDENGQAVRRPEFANVSFDGKVTVASGNAVAAASSFSRLASGSRQTLIVVTARIQETPTDSEK